MSGVSSVEDRTSEGEQGGVKRLRRRPGCNESTIKPAQSARTASHRSTGGTRVLCLIMVV
jgi:hypothetical protein